MKEEAVRCLYKSVEARLHGMTFAQFKRSINGWSISPVTDLGEVIGAVRIRGPEIHVGFSRRPVSTIRRQIRKELGALVSKYGFAETKVISSNESGIKFCERLGFKKVNVSDGIVFLRCDRAKYE